MPEPVNLDAMDVKELEEYAKDGRHPWPLRDYAIAKMLAMTARLEGRIDSALKIEAKCAGMYKALPEHLKTW